MCGATCPAARPGPLTEGRITVGRFLYVVQRGPEHVEFTLALQQPP